MSSSSAGSFSSPSLCSFLGAKIYPKGRVRENGILLSSPSAITLGEWVRTFAVITTDANELVADIHDRMPVILKPEDYDRWLGLEPDPRDLLRPFPAEVMRMWPTSTRVNSPKNDDPDLLDPVPLDSSDTPSQGPNSL